MRIARGDNCRCRRMVRCGHSPIGRLVCELPPRRNEIDSKAVEENYEGKGRANHTENLHEGWFARNKCEDQRYDIAPVATHVPQSSRFGAHCARTHSRSPSRRMCDIACVIDFCCTGHVQTDALLCARSCICANRIRYRRKSVAFEAGKKLALDRSDQRRPSECEGGVELDERRSGTDLGVGILSR